MERLRAVTAAAADNCDASSEARCRLRNLVFNAARSKQNYGSDNDCADLLMEILRDVPVRLNRHKRSALPLLDALQDVDAALGGELVRDLLFVAAVIHRTADERRTAEYLLRNRETVIGGQRSALALLRAARYAAAMDVHRASTRELPVSNDALATRVIDSALDVLDVPSLGEVVLSKLRVLTGHEPDMVARTRIHDAVVVAVQLAERHMMNRGRIPSLLAMRADARKQSRLVTYLRAEFGDDAAAASVARLLVGPDGSPIETALLWWTAQRNVAASDVPVLVRQRWVHYVRRAGAVSKESQVGRRGCRRGLSTGRDR